MKVAAALSMNSHSLGPGPRRSGCSVHLWVRLGGRRDRELDGWTGGQIDLSPLLGTPLPISYQASRDTSQSSGSPDAPLLALSLSGMWSLSVCSVYATFASSWAYPLSDSGPGLPLVREQGSFTAPSPVLSREQVLSK